MCIGLSLALCAQRDAAISLLLSDANTKTFSLQLQEASQAVSPGATCHGDLGSRGWHNTPKLPQLASIALLRLRTAFYRN
jgi:hypothetical protein